jgi:hypothetical protein
VYQNGSLNALLTNKEFREDVKSYARSIAQDKIPRLVTTMREMNLTNKWTPWGGQPTVGKKVYRLIGDILIDEGAREYATMVSCTTIEKNYPDSRRFLSILIHSAGPSSSPICSTIFRCSFI